VCEDVDDLVVDKHVERAQGVGSSRVGRGE